MPTVNLVTAAFDALGTTTAKGKKMPGLPIIVLPGRYDEWPEQDIRDHIRQTLPDILKALTKGTPLTLGPSCHTAFRHWLESR